MTKETHSQAKELHSQYPNTTIKKIVKLIYRDKKQEKYGYKYRWLEGYLKRSTLPKKPKKTIVKTEPLIIDNNIQTITIPDFMNGDLTYTVGDTVTFNNCNYPALGKIISITKKESPLEFEMQTKILCFKDTKIYGNSHKVGDIREDDMTWSSRIPQCMFPQELILSIKRPENICWDYFLPNAWYPATEEDLAKFNK